MAPVICSRTGEPGPKLPRKFSEHAAHEVSRGVGQPGVRAHTRTVAGVGNRGSTQKGQARWVRGGGAGLRIRESRDHTDGNCRAAGGPRGDKPFGVWWRGGPDAQRMHEMCPYIRGVFVAFRWSMLEPKPGEFDWTYFDGEMTRYARAGFDLQFMVWVGENSPRWIYDHGVPEVETTPTQNPHGVTRHDTYPFYLNENYQRFYHRMIREVAAHLDRLPQDVRAKIVSLQTAEGNTGDEGGYKGQPLNPAYRLPEPEWNAFKFETWKLFASLYAPKQPKIHVLINSGNQGQYHDWLMANMPDTWRKAGNPGHGYQLNDEMAMFRFLDPVINRRNVNGEFIRCRSEMDEAFKGWFKEAPVWNQYWLNLWGLTFGLDIFQHETSVFNDPRHDAGFIFFDRYAGEKDPATSPGAFCALHDGLDAADEQRFPVAEFGRGGLAPRNADPQPGMARAAKIAEAFARFGARQGDPEKSVRVVMQNRDAQKMNDVGWNIWTGNYGRYLTQFDPRGTSQGYWRVGDPAQPYGRFARGFDPASSRDAMFFTLDPAFYGQPLAGQRPVQIRVVYFDRGTGAWALAYDAVSAPQKIAREIKNTNTGRWREIVVTLDDANFGHRGPHDSDVALLNRSRDITLFHLVEIRR